MKQPKKLQLQYNAVQSLFWVTVGFAATYASVFLQDKGIPNSAIGMILGAAFILSTILQPLMAAVVDRYRIPLVRAIVAVQLGVVAISLALCSPQLPNWAAGALLMGIISLNTTLQTSVNSLAQVLEQRRQPINFGVARGLASLTFALVMALTGQVLQRVSPAVLPLCYLTTTVLNLLLLLSMKPLRGAVLTNAAKDSPAGGFPGIREYPWFWVFLASVLMLSMGEATVANFLLQIMQSVGGGSSSVGLAVGISAGMEFPSMMLYSRFSKRFGVTRLLPVAAWLWILKLLLIFAAKSPEMVMAAQVLQFCTFAIYAPGSIEFVGSIMPPERFLKAQTMTITSYSLGYVLSSLMGGVMLDTMGVHSTLGIMACAMAAGALLMTVGVRNCKKQ